MVMVRHIRIFGLEFYPESVVLLRQMGQDVGVEHSSLQEAVPQTSQLRAELVNIFADLLSHLLMAFLQLRQTIVTIT